jgi:hypothetical protein
MALNASRSQARTVAMIEKTTAADAHRTVFATAKQTLLDI